MKAFYLILLLSLTSHVLQAAAPLAKLAEGKKSLVIQSGDTKAMVKLPIPEEMSVEGPIKIHGDSDFFIVVTELASHDTGTTLIHAFDHKGRVLWFKDLKAFNPSTPLIEKNFVYLATIGQAWKLDKKTGVVVWTRDGLYENQQFNGKGKIERNKNLIVFAANVQVDDQSGKLKQVTP